MTIKTWQHPWAVVKKREVYSNTTLPQETRAISNNQPNLTPKATTKRTKKIPKLVEGKTS